MRLFLIADLFFVNGKCIKSRVSKKENITLKQINEVQDKGGIIVFLSDEGLEISFPDEKEFIVQSALVDLTMNTNRIFM